jgi:hypothetical protein
VTDLAGVSLLLSVSFLFCAIRDTNTLTHTSGIYSFLRNAFNPIDRTLYVLIQESKKVLQSTLTGELIGDSLDVSIAEPAEGIHFVPSTGRNGLRQNPTSSCSFRQLAVVIPARLSSFRLLHALAIALRPNNVCKWWYFINIV